MDINPPSPAQYPPSSPHPLTPSPPTNPTNHNHQPPNTNTAMDYTQTYTPLELLLKRPLKTPAEETALQERKTKELKLMGERADAALEGNRRLLERIRVEGKRIGAKRVGAEAEESAWFR